MSKIIDLLQIAGQIVILYFQKRQQDTPVNRLEQQEAQNKLYKLQNIMRLKKEIKNAQKYLKDAIGDCDRIDIEHWSGLVRNKKRELATLQG